MRQITQTLQSMTGFARSSGTAQGCSFSCEIRSVNSRGLDVRLRLAPGLDAIEAGVRQVISDRLSRGSITLAVTLQRDQAETEIVVNQQALGAVLDALDALSGRIEADRPRLDGILALHGVLDIRQTPLGPDAEEALHKAILDAVDIALDDLIDSRRAEGERLTAIVIERIEEIEALTKLASGNPARQRDAILARLTTQIEDLKATGTGLDEARLHQEALLLATKADIREELDRLGAHADAARTLIAKGGPIGRKLDFLSQEFNREANTLCSKSNDVSLTAVGLDLKAAIDQLREQIQNIE
ncbi:MAG: YicC/YloC family endoribonuclease [Cucumibacter sp.]